MPVLHQEVDAMLFERNREWIVLGYALQHLHIQDVEFIAARRAFIRADFARHDHGGLLRELLYAIKHLRRHRALWHDPLDESATVAKNGKEELTALAQIVEPSSDGDALPLACPDLGNSGDGSFGSSNGLFFDFHTNQFAVRKSTGFSRVRLGVSLHNGFSGRYGALLPVFPKAYLSPTGCASLSAFSNRPKLSVAAEVMSFCDSPVHEAHCAEAPSLRPNRWFLRRSTGARRVPRGCHAGAWSEFCPSSSRSWRARRLRNGHGRYRSRSRRPRNALWIRSPSGDQGWRSRWRCFPPAP